MTLDATLQVQLHERGIHVTECCDRCGQLLGAMRYTRAGEVGVFCSQECRGDGEWQRMPAMEKGSK